MATVSRRRNAVLAGWAVALLVFAGCTAIGAATREPAPGSPTRTQLEQLLATVTVIPERPQLPGYERGCRKEQLCVFGPAWSDDTDAPGGHDGCDTRNNVLARQMTNVEFRPGTRDCVVVAGTLADPYSGQTVTFSKSRAGDVQIDHVYPLAAAWDMGAATWPLERRMTFANDVDYNLLAVDGGINQAKRDDTPQDWLPPDAAYHCFYAGKYLTVAVQYGLPVTEEDHDALADVARSCG